MAQSVVSHPRLVPASTTELGIAVYLSDAAPLADGPEIALAHQVFGYVKSLDANSVSINFPFYEVGQTPTNGQMTASAVQSGSGTPSVQLLASFVRVAQQDGLTVQLRPLLSEEGDSISQAFGWRGAIAPANVNAWFQSYWTWLRPYLVMARTTGVGSFSIGAELSSLLPYATNWIQLIHRAQSVYGPNVIYSNAHAALLTVPSTRLGFDAYFSVTPPTGTTVNQSNAISIFTNGIQNGFVTDRFPATFRTTRIEEVGIAAVRGAWQFPNVSLYPAGTPIVRWVQADWYTATCNVAKSLHMHGLYFWGVGFNYFSPSYNADVGANSFRFQGTISETAIKSCFDSF